MVINAMTYGAAYNVEGHIDDHDTNRVTIELTSKPYVVLAIPISKTPFEVVGRFAYALLNPETNTYIAQDQSGVNGGTVNWTKRTLAASWDEAEKKFTMYVQCSKDDTITYHAVG